MPVTLHAADPAEAPEVPAEAPEEPTPAPTQHVHQWVDVTETVPVPGEGHWETITTPAVTRPSSPASAARPAGKRSKAIDCLRGQ